MESPRKHKSSDAVKEEVESEDGKDLLVKRRIFKKKLVKRRRIEVSESIVQLQQQIEAFDMENKAPDSRSVEYSTGKDTMDVLTSCAANGHSSESASSRLLKICKTIGWKEPSYDFEEQGSPQHIIMDTLHLVVMEPLRKRNSSGVPVKEEMELEDGNDLLVKRRRTDVSGSIVQLQQQTEVFDMENKASDSLPLEDSSGKDPMNVLTSRAVQNSGQANGRRNESAISKLMQICKAEPSYDFEEQGPPHMKLFKCKVTVHLDGPVNTIVECFSDPKPRKKAAKEHAAQGALWYLKASGYVKGSPDVPE